MRDGGDGIGWRGHLFVLSRPSIPGRDAIVHACPGASRAIASMDVEPSGFLDVGRLVADLLDEIVEVGDTLPARQQRQLNDALRESLDQLGGRIGLAKS